MRESTVSKSDVLRDLTLLFSGLISTSLEIKTRFSSESLNSDKKWYYHKDELNGDKINNISIKLKIENERIYVNKNNKDVFKAKIKNFKTYNYNFFVSFDLGEKFSIHVS